MQRPPISAESIFEQALQLPIAERSSFVAQACRDNAQQHRHILRLLQAEAEAGTFLESPITLGGRIRQDPAITELPEAHRPGNRIGRYKLLERIGEGGCGQVFMAEQVEPVRRKVALKVIKLGMDTKQVVARFEAERQVLALLDHPNIAKVLDAGATETGRPYFVMELVKGVAITRYADENKLSPRQRLELFLPVCHAVQHAHQRGIIHRDLKPSNVLVADHDGRAVPKVIDFGIAKATTDEVLTEKTFFTAFAQFLGTPAYMSPEQAKLSALDIDTRSDIYSLGVLLYELLTGTTPFDAKRLWDAGFEGIRRIIAEEEPPKPSTRLSTLGIDQQSSIANQRAVEPPKLLLAIQGDMDWIVMKCLEKDRGRRYESVSDLAGDLHRHLSDQPVLASPPSRFYQLQKLVRRHRLPVAFATVLLSVLILTSLIATQLAVWARQEQRAAEAARDKSIQLAKDEAQARKEAREQKDRAELHAKASKDRLARLQLANGLRLLDQGDNLSALPWFLEALKIESDSKERSDMHRRRLAAVLGAAPRLTQIWWVEGAVRHLDFSGDGREIVVVSQIQDETESRRLKLFAWASGESRSPLGMDSPLDSRVQLVGGAERVLNASSNGLVRILSIRTRHLSPEFQPGDGSFERILLSPAGDLVLTVKSHAARLWQSGTSEAASPVLSLAGDVNHAGFSPDGRILVIATSLQRQVMKGVSLREHSQVGIWDVASGRPLFSPLDFGFHEIKDCVFRQDGKRFLSVHDDEIQQWSLETGVSVGVAIPRERLGPFTHAAYSPDGLRILVANGASHHRNGSARLFDAGTGEPIALPLDHARGVNQAVFSPGGDLVATVSSDRRARIWNSETGKPFTPELVHESPVLRAAFSPDGQKLITGTASGMIRVWDLPGSTTAARLEHEARRVTQAEFSRDGGKLLTASYDGKARIWDVDTRSLLVPPLDHGTGNRVVVHAAFHPSGDRVLSIAGDLLDRLELWVWDAQTGKPMGHQAGVSMAEFSHDGAFMAAVVGSTVRFLDAAGAQERGQLRNPGRIGSIQLSADSRRILVLGENKTLRLFDLSTKSDTVDFRAEEGAITDARFTPDATQVVIAREDGSIRFCNAVTGSPTRPNLQLPAKVTALSFSPDGDQLLATSGRTVTVLETRSPQQGRIQLPHLSEVTGARFSPDRSMIATWSYEEGKVWLWQASTGHPLGPPLSHSEPVDFALFHPEGHHLLTGTASAAEWWSLAEEKASMSALEVGYQVLSCFSLNEAGGLSELSPQAIRERWNGIPAADSLHLPSSAQEKNAWLERRASLMEQQKQWFAAAFYLDQMLTIGSPNRSENEARRVRAKSEWRRRASGAWGGQD